jgi:hypothetical protein
MLLSIAAKSAASSSQAGRRICASIGILLFYPQEEKASICKRCNMNQDSHLFDN